MWSSSDLLKVCDARASEARLLYQNNYYHTAIYLLSYALECAMKAMICKNTGGFPEIHSFKELREKCRIPVGTFQEQWQTFFLDRDNDWVAMRYQVDQFGGWDENRRVMYYNAGFKLVTFFKRKAV